MEEENLRKSLVKDFSHVTSLVISDARSNFPNVPLTRCNLVKKKVVDVNRKISTGAIATPSTEEIQEYKLFSWALFEIGTAPVYCKTMNGLPPSSELKLFHNPAVTPLALNEEFGIAFNGGFNQPITSAGEPKAMPRKDRGEADSPMYPIQICIPKHGIVISHYV